LAQCQEQNAGRDGEVAVASPVELRFILVHVHYSRQLLVRSQIIIVRLAHRSSTLGISCRYITVQVGLFALRRLFRRERTKNIPVSGERSKSILDQVIVIRRISLRLFWIFSYSSSLFLSE